MRKFIIALIAGATLMSGLALPAAASAQAGTDTPLGAHFICDGDGLGSCKSLERRALMYPGEPVVAIGETSGAWRWYIIAFQTGGRTDYIFELNASIHDKTVYCNGNSDGGDVIKPCDNSASETWTFVSGNMLENVGRSNDKGTTEVLCNKGGIEPLVIVPPGSCSMYHETWAFS